MVIQLVNQISQYHLTNFQLVLIVQLVLIAVYLMDEYSGNGLHVQSEPLHNTVNEEVGSHHDLKMVKIKSYKLYKL